MEKVFQLGISDEMPTYLKGHIVIANKAALFMALVGLAYSVFSLVVYPQLAIYSFASMLICLGTLWLNLIGWYNLSRYILSVIVMVQASIYHGFLAQEGEPVLTTMILVQLSLSVVPWVIIDFRERLLLTASLVTCYIILFAQGLINESLVMELNNDIFVGGYMVPVSYLFAVGVLIACLAFMQFINYEAVESNNRLIEEVNQKSVAMEEQQTTLKHSLDELNVARKEDEKRTWIASGLSEMNDILRNTESMELYQKLITGIVKYLKVVQGGIYLVREDEQGEIYLNLEACYAFDRIKFINKRIEIGQGLVGECYLEKENIILKQVPEDYINITSGLGDAPPNYVSIIPIKSDDDLKGILELASFKALEDHELLFLEKLGETLTVFITNHVINERTKQLLEHSQMQTEQLRAQEEEMRQNMEEMQATQEEMQRKEKEYIARIESLEKNQ